MTKIVNLNKVRKQRDRSAKRAKADENAVKFGRSKAERTADAQKTKRDQTLLDSHKRET